jgi:hypothetical protein
LKEPDHSHQNATHRLKDRITYKVCLSEKRNKSANTYPPSWKK